MRGWLTSIVLATVLVVVVGFAVAGCGGQKRTIPTRKAQSFLAQLDKIGEQVDSGSCTGAADKVASLKAQVSGLPGSVDPTVKRNLVDGVQRLDRLVGTQCQRPTPANTTPTTTPTVPTTPSTTVPTTPTGTVPTTPSNTVPTPPTAPTTTPTSPSTTPGGGGGGVTVPGTIGGGDGG